MYLVGVSRGFQLAEGVYVFMKWHSFRASFGIIPKSDRLIPGIHASFPGFHTS